MNGLRAAAAMLPVLICGAVSSQAVKAAPVAVGPEPGDIVLSRGTGIWSQLFADLNQRDRRYSHAGVVVANGGVLKVVHAAADDDGSNGRVRLDSFDEYAAGTRKLVLLRLRDRGTSSRVARAALSMHAAALPFDFDFRLTDAGAVYCSELVWIALKAALQHDPLPNKPFMAGRQAVLIENFLLDVPELKVVER